MDAVPSNPVPQTFVRMTIPWLSVCLVATLAVSLAAAHAPHRIRLIGLFSIAFGLLIGWSVTQLSEMLEIRPSARLAGIVAATLAFLGLAGSTWETWRLEELRQDDVARERVAERMLEQLKVQAKTGNIKPIKDSALSGFRWYLSQRIHQLGRWQSPTPELFWGLELIMAATASGITAFRIQKFRLTTIAREAEPDPIPQ